MGLSFFLQLLAGIEPKVNKKKIKKTQGKE